MEVIGHLRCLMVIHCMEVLYFDFGLN